MKRKYSDPLVFPALMLNSQGIDIGEDSVYGTAPDPDGAAKSKLSVNSQRIPMTSADGMLLDEGAVEEPSVVIEESPVEELDSAMDVLTGEENPVAETPPEAAE